MEIVKKSKIKKNSNISFLALNGLIVGQTTFIERISRNQMEKRRS